MTGQLFEIDDAKLTQLEPGGVVILCAQGASNACLIARIHAVSKGRFVVRVPANSEFLSQMLFDSGLCFRIPQTDGAYLEGAARIDAQDTLSPAAFMKDVRLSILVEKIQRVVHSQASYYLT